MRKPNRLLFYCLFLPVLLAVFSCSKKIPHEWQALEGVWQNEEVYMSISKDGSFSYKRESNGQTVSIGTWLTDYSSKGFTASTVFGKTDFVVNKKPFYNQSLQKTQMVVDGRILTKQNNW